MENMTACRRVPVDKKYGFLDKAVSWRLGGHQFSVVAPDVETLEYVHALLGIEFDDAGIQDVVISDGRGCQEVR